MDWNTPTVTSSYLTDVLQDLTGRDVDAACATQSTSPTNTPSGFRRFNTSTNLWESWNGSSWIAIVLSIAGGGTGATTAAAAQANLGLGSMATQNSNAVAITGGSIAGVTVDASVITSGVLALARGGTGASLALGILGQVLYSNGLVIAFADGDQIAKLNASNLTSGTVPLVRLSGITDTQIDPVAAIQWSKISKTGSNLTDLVTRSATTAFTTGIVPQSNLGSGSLGTGTKALYDDQTYKVVSNPTKNTWGAEVSVPLDTDITETADGVFYGINTGNQGVVMRINGNDRAYINQTPPDGGSWGMVVYHAGETFHGVSYGGSGAVLFFRPFAPLS